jgi:predicted AlkP superfamily pyrophosphatase or phosphodiesterase
VSPSVTAAAMTSLLTGVGPNRHGVRSDRFHIPRSAGALSPLPRVLSAAHYPTSAHMAAVPLLFRGIAARIAAQLGVADAKLCGVDAPTILQAARHTLTAQRRGLIVMHWPDADRAGHAHGWMSDAYGDAAQRIDSTLGLLMALTEIPRDRGTLLITVSDHGGGGMDPRNHDSDHPLDRQILLMLNGGSVQPAILPDGASILDVPATVLWALGIAAPADYAGRPLVGGFRRDDTPAPVAA